MWIRREKTLSRSAFPSSKQVESVAALLKSVAIPDRGMLPHDPRKSVRVEYFQHNNSPLVNSAAPRPLHQKASGAPGPPAYGENRKPPSSSPRRLFHEPYAVKSSTGTGSASACGFAQNIQPRSPRHFKSVINSRYSSRRDLLIAAAPAGARLRYSPRFPMLSSAWCAVLLFPRGERFISFVSTTNPYCILGTTKEERVQSREAAGRRPCRPKRVSVLV